MDYQYDFAQSGKRIKSENVSGGWLSDYAEKLAAREDISFATMTYANVEKDMEVEACGIRNFIFASSGSARYKPDIWRISDSYPESSVPKCFEERICVGIGVSRFDCGTFVLCLCFGCLCSMCFPGLGENTAVPSCESA